MAERRRSISPVGASKFERPYTLPRTSLVPTRDLQASIATQSRLLHGDVSRSSWSTIESSPGVGYSTAPTSALQSPVEQRTIAVKDASAWLEHESDEAYNAAYADADDWYVRPDGYDAHDDDNVDDNDEDDYDYVPEECPDPTTLAEAESIPVYSADGREIPFGSLYRPDMAVHQRQLIIFVRHFYCGACQAYLKAISDSISLQDYFSIPIPTSIIVIGCGSPRLIPFYKAVTGTCFPIFAEPSRQLYRKLGMVLSGRIGRERPEYMKDISNHAWMAGQVKTVREGLRARKNLRMVSPLTHGFDFGLDDASARASSSLDGASGHEDHAHLSIHRQLEPTLLQGDEAHLAAMALRKRDLIRGGNLFQIGGEFLLEDGEVIWCHRMRHARDHVEVADLRRLLELDD